MFALCQGRVLEAVDKVCSGIETNNMYTDSTAIQLSLPPNTAERAKHLVSPPQTTPPPSDPQDVYTLRLALEGWQCRKSVESAKD